MKKIIAIFTAMAFALTLGVAVSQRRWHRQQLLGSTGSGSYEA